LIVTEKISASYNVTNCVTYQSCVAARSRCRIPLILSVPQHQAARLRPVAYMSTGFIVL